jgi:TRAP-type mannitol/chloroaromatic compound transport system substrate-binding protein
VLKDLSRKLTWMAAAALLQCSIIAFAEERHRLSIKVTTSYPVGVPILGEALSDMAQRVSQASDGRVSLVFHQPQQWGEASGVFEAVGSGRIQAAWLSAGWLAKEDSAFGMFYAIPFGPGATEYLAWLYRGGGLGLARELFHQRGIHNIPCVVLPPAGSGWFRGPVNTLEDLQGLRIRSFSLGEMVLEKLGAQTRDLAPVGISEAVKTGSLDAVDLLNPSIDKSFQLHTVLQYYYFPSWHKQSALFQFFINKSLWDAFSERDRTLIESACSETMLHGITLAEATQAQAMKDMQSAGVQLRRWQPHVLVALEKAWGEVVAEQSAKNPNFKRVYESYAAFRDSNALWRYFSPLH